MATTKKKIVKKSAPKKPATKKPAKKPIKKTAPKKAVVQKTPQNDSSLADLLAQIESSEAATAPKSKKGAMPQPPADIDDVNLDDEEDQQGDGSDLPPPGYGTSKEEQAEEDEDGNGDDADDGSLPPDSLGELDDDSPQNTDNSMTAEQGFSGITSALDKGAEDDNLQPQQSVKKSA